MKKLLGVLLLLGGACSAQIPTFPQLVQLNGSTGTSLAFGHNVTSGNLIYVAFHSETNSTPPTVSDTLSTSFGSPVVSSASSCGWEYSWAALAPSGGADTVSLSAGGSFQDFHIAEFKNVTATTDGTGTATWASLTTITSPSITTSNNGSLIISSIHSCNSGSMDALLPGEQIVYTSSGDASASSYRVAGANGSYTMSFSWPGGGSGGNINIVAFKPTASLATSITTTNIPDAIKNVSYSFTLQAVGGAGAYTWSITSGTLPSGLSLNSSTGVVSGTPGSSPDEMVTFRVTDGTHPSTKVLTMHVGNSASAITFGPTASGGDCGSGVSNIVTSVAGDVAIVTVAGDGTYLTDTLGNSFQALPWRTDLGTQVVTRYWAIITHPGLETITCDRGSHQFVWAEFGGVQLRYDENFAGLLGSATTASNSLTPSVPGELLYSTLNMPSNSGCGPSIAASSPFTDQGRTAAGGEVGDSSYYVSSTSSSQTSTYTGALCGWQFGLFALRPSVTDSGPPVGGIPTWLQTRADNVGSLAYANDIDSTSSLLITTWHSENQTTAPTISDSCGSNWTLQVSQGNSSNIAYGYTWTATAACTGPDTITVTAAGTTNQSIAIGEVKNATATKDVSATANNNCTSNSVTMPNVTTTKYSDLILDVHVAHGSEILGNSSNSAYAVVMNGGTTDEIIWNYLVPTTAPGTVTGPTYYCPNGRNASQAVLAIKSAASLTVAAPAGGIPDAIKSQTYNYQLEASGGDGGAHGGTWTTTSGSLPAGLALSSAGNINGTCTNSNPNAITFQVSDINSHTATLTTTVNCANSASTIAKTAFAGQGSGNSSIGPFTDTAGDAIIVCTAWNLQNRLGVPKVSSTRGETFTLLPGVGIAIADAAPNNTNTRIAHLCFLGFVGGSGSALDTISFNPNTVTSVSWAITFSNVQQTFDTEAISMVYGSTAGTVTLTSNSITSPVSETLYSFTAYSSATSFTVGSGFTSGGATDHRGFDEYKIGASQGSNTSTFSATGLAGEWGITLFGLRPTASGTAPSPPTTLETSPWLRQSQRGGTNVKPVTFSANVLSGSTIIVTYTDASHTVPSFTGTRGETFTKIKECADVGQSRWIDVYTGVTTSAGPDTITASAAGTHVHTNVHEVVNLDGTLDASACGTWSGTSSTSSSITSTTNGDFMLLVVVDNSSLINVSPAFPSMMASDDNGDIGNHTFWRLAGANGSYSDTWYSDNAAGSYAYLALKPSSALTVTTSAIPDAFGGNVYKFQLQATGGSGAYTWAITAGSLQSGLSLSSGGLITGTPGAGGTNTITFQVTDGAAATATKSLTLFVGSTQGTIAQVRSTRINSSACGGGSSISTVTTGDTVMLVSQHNNGSFSLPVFTDSLGTTYYPIQLMLSAASNTVGAGSTVSVPYIGAALATGTDTLTCSTTQGATTVAASEFSSVQDIVESAVTAGTIGQAASSTTITSNNLSFPVGGELAYSSAEGGPTGSITSLTVQSPFSTGTTSLDAYQLGVTSGNHSVSYATVQTGSIGWGTQLLGLRAGISGVFTGHRKHAVIMSTLHQPRYEWRGSAWNRVVAGGAHAGDEAAEVCDVRAPCAGLAFSAYPDRHGAHELPPVHGPALRADDPGD